MFLRPLCGAMSLPLLLSLSLAMALCSYPARAGEAPTFGDPVVRPSSACDRDTVRVVRTDDGKILSLIRSKGLFLETLGSGRQRARARCRIDIVFATPLTQAAMLQVELRGGVIKQADSALSVAVKLGSQRHQLDSARGELLDANALYRQFHVLRLARGARKLRIDIKGTADSYSGLDSVRADIDTLDLCFVDPAIAQQCRGADSAPPATPALPAPLPVDPAPPAAPAAPGQ